MHEKFLKRLMATMKCSVCGQRYEASNVNVLGHQEELWFLSVFCSSCHSHGLVAAVVKDARTPEGVSDLTETELYKYNSSKDISVDDVLDMHNFLKDFPGDFVSLFKK
ncbi:MAG: hypothetical protein HYX92_19565 [Chloroflexi bacterium]|nr:hypothetical protein [Chloroflexota bacterium]